MGEGRAGSGGGGTLSGIQVFTGAIAYGCSVTNKIRPPPPFPYVQTATFFITYVLTAGGHRDSPGMGPA